MKIIDKALPDAGFKKTQIEDESGDFETLQYAPPDPKSSTQLTEALIIKLLGYLEKWFKWLQKSYGNDVDVPSWKKLAKQIFESLENLKPIVCPARAGFGKSTFIKALLLTLCELKVKHDPLADVFGGAILVVQKVETLNEIHDIIYRAFPEAGPDLMIPLQSLTPSGLKSGVCLNECQMDPPRCFRSSCTFSRECKLRYYEENADQAYVLGITQSRFYRLRTTNNLAKYLSIPGAPSPRRIFIFDEVFNFADSQALLAEAASAASIELEALAAKLEIPDRLISRVEIRFSCTVRNFFQHLRSDTVYSVDGVTQADLKYGTCTLKDLPEEDKQGFLNFKEYLETTGRRYLSENVRLGVNVVADLLKGRCLFTKLPNFTILSPGTPQLIYGSATTIVFDATAQVDPNYMYVDARILDVLPPEHMDMVTFHIFTHPDMNTSRNAFMNPWKLPAICAVVDELLEQYPGKTFLCTYMDYSEAFSRKLSQKSMSKIIPLSNNARGLSIPYWGGNNGSNDFNQAVNCILIGTPRLRPKDFLESAYTYWEPSGIRAKVQEVSEQCVREGTSQSGYIENDIPELKDYEDRYLAAKFEQEIYRCSLRNRECTIPIHVFLFMPPEGTLKILKRRFHGARFETIKEAPYVVGLIKTSFRQYNGGPTAFARLESFLRKWDGASIPLTTLQERTEISPSGWKNLQKNPRFDALMAQYLILRSGRGPNVRFYRDTGSRESVGGRDTGKAA